ncbi:MAG: helix-turn-helix domain-containing protein [Solirubrobacteraceae bacterium]
MAILDHRRQRVSDWPPGEEPAEGGRRPVYRLSLESGLRVLSQFGNYADVLSEGELAARSGLSPSTTHKCVRTLSEFGFLVETRSRRYRLPRRQATIRIRSGRRR